MPEALCPICKEYFQFSKFQFLSCGHGFCPDCTTELKKQPKCAICNERSQDYRKIYVEFVTSHKDKVGSVVDHLGRLDMTSKGISLKKVGGKVRQVVEGITPADEDSKEMIASIHAAVEDLQSRLVPTFLSAESLSAENASLKSENAKLRSLLSVAHDDLTKHVNNHSQRNAEKRLATAKQELRQANTALTSEKETSARWERRFEKQSSALAELEAENASLKEVMDDKEKEVKLARRKLNALLRSMKTTKSARVRVDDSLCVADDTAELENEYEILPDETKVKPPASTSGTIGSADRRSRRPTSATIDLLSTLQSEVLRPPGKKRKVER